MLWSHRIPVDAADQSPAILRETRRTGAGDKQRKAFTRQTVGEMVIDLLQGIGI